MPGDDQGDEFELGQPPPGQYSVDGQVFVKFFPSQRSAARCDLDSVKLFIGRIAQSAVSLSRERDLAAIVQFDVDLPTIDPGP